MATLPRATLQRVLLVSGIVIVTLSLTHLLLGQIHPETIVRTIPLSRTVRIPLATTSSAAGQGSKTLLVSEAGTDELPEGPAAFDVFDDGSLLIADPLSNRLAVFSSRGEYQKEFKIGFAADDVTIMPGGLILVREASTGDNHLIDREGKPRQGETTPPPEAEAKLLTDKTGTVMRASGGLLQVTFDKPGLRLLSIQALATDQEGNTFVALEATPGGEIVDVSKYVQEYAASGKLVSEVADIPLDYYVIPVDELKVRKGVLYQLRSTASEIQINEWEVK
jgi:hypothetical protein